MHEDVRSPVQPWNVTSMNPASVSIERSDTLQAAPAIHPDHESMVRNTRIPRLIAPYIDDKYTRICVNL